MTTIAKQIAAIKEAIKGREIGFAFRDRLELVFYHYTDNKLTTRDKTVIRRAYNGIGKIEDYPADGESV